MKTLSTEYGDEMIKAKLFPWSLHIAVLNKREVLALGIHLTRYFLWMYFKCTFCLCFLVGERKGRQGDSVVCDSLLCLGFYFGTLLILSEFMSLLEGERASGNG